MPGPPPKREAERRRRNKDGVETLHVNLDETLAGDIEIPAPPMKYVDDDGEELDEPEPKWHPIAEGWYLSLTRSGQAIFYESSDWAVAYMIAEQISIAMEPRPVQIGTDEDGAPIFRTMVIPMPGATLNGILKANASLMALEGDRRRLRIELDRKKRQDAAIEGEGKVVDIATQRSKVFEQRQA